MGEFDYSKKSGLVTSFIMIPQDVLNNVLNSKGLEICPQEIKNEIKARIEQGDVKNLWRSIEEKEKRKDAQLCQELIISLQKELPLEENIKNLKILIQEHFISKGKVADICIHNTKSGDNPHAHILLTQRPLEQINIDLKTGSPLYEFGKKIREEGQFYSNGNKVDTITPIREQWANLCNVSFANAKLDVSISHKTLEAQRAEALEKGDFIKAAELDREPVKHIYRNENVVKRAEIEANAEKAAIYNEKEIKRHKSQLEMVELGVITPDLVVEPVFKPILKTFKDFLKFRTEEKARIIQENVTRYIKDRTVEYSRFIRKARARANQVVETVGSVIRNQRQRMVAEINRNSNIKAKSTFESLNKNESKQSRELEYAPRYTNEHQIKKDISILAEFKDHREINKIFRYVKNNIEVIRNKEEFVPLLEAMVRYSQRKQEMINKNKVVAPVETKNDDKYKNNPFYISTPKYTPF